MKKYLHCLVFISGATYGQVSQIWFDVNVQGDLKKRWSWSGDAGSRFTIHQSLSVAFGRGAVIYKASQKATLYGGLAYFHYAASRGESTINEVRPWQGIRFDFKLSPFISLTNYTRLEQRNLVNEGNNNFLLRFRNLTGATFTFFKGARSDQSLYLPLSFEFFDDVNKKLVINRHRTYIGLGYGFLKNRIEFHYIMQQSRSDANDSFELTENVYRLRWFRFL